MSSLKKTCILTLESLDVFQHTEGGEETVTEEARDLTVSSHGDASEPEPVVPETQDETVSSQDDADELEPAVAEIDKSIIKETFESTEDQVEQQHDNGE